MMNRWHFLKLWLGGRLNRLTAPPPEDATAPSLLLLEPGRKVAGRYRLQRILGEGGMGRVWLAQDEQDQRQVAFKEMRQPPNLTAAQRAEASLLFRHEFHSMRKLQHPGTVRVYDAGEIETGDRFIAMEVVPGHDLAELVQRQPFSTSKAYGVLIQLAQVLSFIHSRLFVHSDIKAENIRVTPTGETKLMDFGLMHQLGTPAGGQLKGTPGYMAPEWPRGGVIDARTDLYSLGVLGFFLVTGRMPFAGRTLLELLDGHLNKPPPKPSSLASVEPELERIILALLSKEPKDRPADAAELVGLLCQASGQKPQEEPLAARASYLHISELVGREQEMTRLSSALTQAREGRAKSVILAAPPGVGKSRLLQEFELKVRLEDIPFGMGQCRPEGLAPLAPFKQALRTLASVTPPEVLAPHRSVLANYLPEGMGTTPPKYKDPSQEKMAIFAALAGWLKKLAEVRPFVLCLEDIHWADHATLEHMNAVIRELVNTRGLMLATVRSTEVDRFHIGFQTVEEGASERLDLAQLTLGHVQSLVSLALRGFQVPSEFVERLYGTSQGNAFFAIEQLRALVEDGSLDRVGAQWTARQDLRQVPLSESLDQLVSSRLRLLNPSQLGFLRRVAPAGRALEMGLLRSVGQLDENALFAVLDEAAERQFLVYSDGRYYFAHETVREHIYRATEEAERKQAHLYVAQYLSATFQSRPEMQRAIGYHFGQSTEPVKAIEPLLVAGDHALQNKALLEATQLMRQAAQLLDQHPDYPRRGKLMVPLWSKLVEVGFNGHPPTCIEFGKRLFSHWESGKGFAAAQTKVIEKLRRADRATDSTRKKLLAPVIKEITVQETLPLEDAVLKRAEYRTLVSVALGATGQRDAAEEIAAQAMVEQPPCSPYRYMGTFGRFIVYGHTGRFDLLKEMQDAVESLRRLREELGAFTRRENWAMGLGDYLFNMTLANSGRPLNGQSRAEGEAIAEEFGFSDIRLHHLNSRITRAMFTGHGPEFQGLWGDINDLIRQLGNPRLLASRVSLFAPVYFIERQEWDFAEDSVNRLRKFVELMPTDAVLKLYAQTFGAVLGTLRPNASGGQLPLDEAEKAAEKAEFRFLAYLRAYRAKHELEQGRVEQARRLAQLAFQRATDARYGNPFDEIVVRRVLARIEPEAAMSHLEVASKLATETQSELQQGIIQLAMAEQLIGQNRAMAAEAISQAQERLRAIQSSEWLSKLEAFRQKAARAS